MTAAAKKPLAIIAGVGAGTGASIARRFATKYTTVLLARKLEHLEPIEKEIKNNGGDAFSAACDVSQPDSVEGAFDKVKKEFPDTACAAAVFNATGPFVMKSILDVKIEDYDAGYNVTMRGALLFSQQVLPLLLAHASDEPPSSTPANHLPPTLIFTGASASLKGSAMFSVFGSPKFGMRGLAQSIAREFAPKGVHVCHAVVDGPIDVPWAQAFLKDKDETEKIDPAAIAETYWSLHCQGRRGWTHEVDIRSMKEKW